MNYKAGDRVKIKSLDWYNENKSHGTVLCGVKYFGYDRIKWCGKTMTILIAYPTCYTMEEDDAEDLWTDEMIEGLVEEEMSLDIDEFQDDNEIIDIIDEYVHRLKDNECQINLPEGYQFTDENGNIINATKIVLEKKEYPKTYEECCRVLEIRSLGNGTDGYKWEILSTFQNLIIYRNAYWKIAGDEMGLGKPWEPDWTANDNHFYTIHTFNGKIECSATAHRNAVLIFPTEEMRDSFYKNFKEEIEICKELL